MVVTEGTDYSLRKYWEDAREETRILFRELEALVESFGNVRAHVLENQVSFKCMDAVDTRACVVAHVKLRTKSVGLRVHILERHVSDSPIAHGFTCLVDQDQYRGFTILDREHIRKAEPLLRAAYDSIRSSARGR